VACPKSNTTSRRPHSKSDVFDVVRAPAPGTNAGVNPSRARRQKHQTCRSRQVWCGMNLWAGGGSPELATLARGASFRTTANVWNFYAEGSG
jgi:hypothetical protein